MLLRMLRDTTLVAYLQQMHQLVLQQGSPGYVVPVVPNSGWGPASQEAHEPSGDARIMRQQCGTDRRASWKRSLRAFQLSVSCMSAQHQTLQQHARLYMGGSDRIAKHFCTCAESAVEAPGVRSSSQNGSSAGWSTSTGLEGSLGSEDARMPQRNTHAARAAPSTGSEGSPAPVAALNGSSSGRRDAVPHAAEPASAMEPSHASHAGSPHGARPGVSAATHSRHSAPAASIAASREARAAAAPTAKHEAEQAAQRAVTRQRQSQPWERELHAPKPYKPALIRRGRRRGRRSLGLLRQQSSKPAA